MNFDFYKAAERKHLQLCKIISKEYIFPCWGIWPVVKHVGEKNYQDLL